MYNALFWEARLLAQKDPKGIPFIQMLLLLAHHKLIDDNKALKWVLFTFEWNRLWQTNADFVP